MSVTRSNRSSAEQGFSLVELLVVILIIGVLAAIAIPLFLGQSTKASDANAEEVVRAGALAAETYATDHSGSFEGLKSPSVLHEYDPAIVTGSGSGNAYLKVAEEKESGQGYVVTAVAPSTGDTFTVARLASGEVKRTCSAGSSAAGGCATGRW